MEGTKKVEVRHAKTGVTTIIGERVWKDWGSAKALDNEIRHGYHLVRTFSVDAKGNELESTPAQRKGAETFKPTFAQEGTSPDAAPVPQEPQGKADNLLAIPSVGNKVAEALNQAGLGTYKAIAQAEVATIEAVLDAMVPPMVAKKAQIPAWKKAAAEFIKAPSPAMV